MVANFFFLHIIDNISREMMTGVKEAHWEVPLETSIKVEQKQDSAEGDVERHCLCRSGFTQLHRKH